MKIIQFTILIFLLFISKYTMAQFSATTNTSATQLAQNLAGPGVQILNPILDCGSTSTGMFTATGTNLGLGSGIVLCTGGPNEASLTSTGFVAGSGIGFDDADLATITTIKQYDVCKLEFDIVPNCNKLDVNYVFASAEYPAYVCSNFNDAFGFFISGPGIVGKQNIALIPGTTDPVTINSINSGTVGSSGYAGGCPANTNSNFYVDNTSKTSINSYGGFTTALVASSIVQACSTYHIKLVIADIGDASLSSAIFLPTGGVTCNPLITINASNDTSICPGTSANLSAIITPSSQAITWSPALGLNTTTGSSVIATPTVTTTYYAYISIAGCNGFTSIIKDSVVVTVLPGPTAAAFISPVSAVCLPAASFNFSTNIAGGTWTGTGITDATTGAFDPAIAGVGNTIIKYEFTSTCGNTEDTLLVIIDDTTLPIITAPYSLCAQGLPISLAATITTGVWSGNGITNINNGIFNPKIAGVGTHIINYNVYKACPVVATASIRVKNALTPMLSNDTAICLHQNAMLSLSNSTEFKNIVWTSMSSILLNGAGPILVSPITTQKYYITTTDTANCIALDSILVQVNVLPKAILAATEVCNTFPTVFTNNSIGAVRGYLSYGDGGADTLYTNISHIYTNSGSAFANFICVSPQGCKDTTQLQVKVNPLPILNFIADTTNGCAELCLNFINTSNAKSYKWFSNGKKISELDNPSNCFKLGEYSILLIAKSDKGCVDSLLRANYIHAYPVPVANIIA